MQQIATKVLKSGLMTATMVANSAVNSAVFHRSLDKDYDIASGGDGCYILHPDGRRTLDGSCGAAVSCLGHGHKIVIDAIVQQATSMAFAHTSFFSNTPAEDLATCIIDQSDGAFSKVMFLSSGSEAVESAIKLARQYHVARDQGQRINFICRDYGYHGNTLGALAAGNNPPRRRAFEPLLSQAFHHVSPCFYSQDGQDGETEEDYVKRLLAEYENTFLKLGTDTVAAIMVETLGGATLGAVPAAKGYLEGLRDLCDRFGALLILDEVMCGMGRTGRLHAWQAYGNVKPDLQTIGKGLGSGYQPISALLVSEKIHQALKVSQLQHPFVSGHTYQGHAIGCAAALAVQNVIVKDKLLENVCAMGDLLEQRLFTSLTNIREIRGKGLFKAVEFEQTCHGPIAKRVSERCLKNGLAVYLCSPAVDAILFAPPFIINADEVNELVEIFTRSVTEVLRESM